MALKRVWTPLVLLPSGIMAFVEFYLQALGQIRLMVSSVVFPPRRRFAVVWIRVGASDVGGG